MYALHCPNCHVPATKNVDYGSKEKGKKGSAEYICSSCSEGMVHDQLIRKFVRAPSKEDLTRTFPLPKDTRGAIVSVSPGLVMTCFLPESVRKITVLHGKNSLTFPFLQRAMAIRWDMMVEGKATHMRCYAWKEGMIEVKPITKVKKKAPTMDGLIDTCSTPGCTECQGAKDINVKILAAMGVKEEEPEKPPEPPKMELRLLVKKFLLSNTEPEEAAICWGKNQPSPRSLRQAATYFFDQPFNADHFQKRVGKTSSAVVPKAMVRVGEDYQSWWSHPPTTEIVVRDVTHRVCTICFSPVKECPCFTWADDTEVPDASGKSTSTAEIVYRFRNYNPYEDQPEFDNAGGWVDGTKMIMGKSFVETKKGVDYAILSSDPELVSQLPERCVRFRGDGTPVLAAFGIKQKPKGFIFEIDGFYFFFLDGVMTPLKKKRMRTRMKRMGVAEPVLPGV